MGAEAKGVQGQTESGFVQAGGDKGQILLLFTNTYFERIEKMDPDSSQMYAVVELEAADTSWNVANSFSVSFVAYFFI